MLLTLNMTSAFTVRLLLVSLVAGVGTFVLCDTCESLIQGHSMAKVHKPPVYLDSYNHNCCRLTTSGGDTWSLDEFGILERCCRW